LFFYFWHLSFSFRHLPIFLSTYALKHISHSRWSVFFFLCMSVSILTHLLVLRFFNFGFECSFILFPFTVSLPSCLHFFFLFHHPAPHIFLFPFCLHVNSFFSSHCLDLHASFSFEVLCFSFVSFSLAFFSLSISIFMHLLVLMVH
jgi:hypothetical protein